MEIASHIANTIKRFAVPIKDRHPSSAQQNYSALLDAIGDAEVVMVGEASHGTHDFYQQRAELTKQLIEKKGFTFIAVEADWPDAYRVNRYVQDSKKADKTAKDALGDFKRFPMWMWRNTVMLNFIDWLRNWNGGKPKEGKVAFYGMDLYSFYSSMDAVVQYLEQVSPEDAKLAKRRYANFERFQGEPSSYGYATGFGLSKSFENEVVSTLVDLQKKEETYLKGSGGLIDGDELFYTKQNAKLVAHAEEYYRKMYHADEITWNLRDSHMADCIQNLFEYHQSKFSGIRKEKVVIWAHNSHLGDARYTEASKRGELNVGQLMREKFGLGRTFNVGFSTFQGSVTAAKQWDEPAQCYRVRNGLYGSYEHVLHAAGQQMGVSDYYMIFRSNNPAAKISPDLLDVLKGPRYERFIGVVYRPDREKSSHYSRSNLPKEYDAVIVLDKTNALEPVDKTAPWERAHDLIQKVPDTDIYPELDNSVQLGVELFEWNMKAATEINSAGVQMLSKNDYEGAFEKFDKAVKYLEHYLPRFQNKRNLQDLRCKALLNRAEASSHLKSWNTVVRDCTTILSLKPSFVQAHLLLGKAYEATGHYGEARKHFDLAATMAADHPMHLETDTRR